MRAGCAVSDVLAPLVSGPERELELVASAGVAAYYRTGDPDLPALCLCLPAAVRVPCAAVMPAVPEQPRLTVGGGRVGPYRVGRWWRARRVEHGCLSFLREVPPELAGDALDLLDVAGEQSLAALGDGLRAGSATAVTDSVVELVGRGPGLTPLSDDVLAGMLIGLRAHGATPQLRLLAEAVAAVADRTTFVSGALLHHAARGESTPELSGLVDTMTSGEPIRNAVKRTLAVGHSSGQGLVHGLHTALLIVTNGSLRSDRTAPRSRHDIWR